MTTSTTAVLCTTLCIFLYSAALAKDTSGNEIVSREVELFRSLYIEKRKEHKEAVKSILAYEDYAKQYKIVEILSEKSFTVLQNCQVKLRESGYVPGMEFPSEESSREALSLMLETTAFMGEILLHLPDITHKILKKQQTNQLSFTWGILFASQSSFLDENTRKLIYLVSQELELAEQDPNYTNPYTNSTANKQPEKKEMKKPKKKKFKKGPRLSRSDEL